jgi:type III secretory pathway component EscU
MVFQEFDSKQMFTVLFSMDFSNKFFAILVLFIITLLLNLPFGYARARTKKYSFRWFLYIHAPIPFIFIIRTISHIQMKYIPIFVVAAVIGQILGGKLEL